MSRLKLFSAVTAVSALVMAFASVASASAASWSPLNTPITATSTDTSLTSGSATVSCTNSSITAEAPSASPSVATASAVSFTGCTNSFGLSPTTVTVPNPSAWTLTAASTSQVNVTGANATITIGTAPLQCVITVSGASVPGNSWLNGSPSTLTINSSASFPVSSSGFCPGVGSTATESGTYSAPGVTIS